MKKSILILAVIIAILSLASCGTDSKKNKTINDGDQLTDSDISGDENTPDSDEITETDEDKDSVEPDENKDADAVEDTDPIVDKDSIIEDADPIADKDTVIEDTDIIIDQDNVSDQDIELADDDSVTPADQDIAVETSVISSIQKGEVAANTELTLTKIVVISPFKDEGVYNEKQQWTFYAADVAGGDFSGLMMFKVAAEAALNIGDEVTVTGKVGAYQGANELMYGTVTKTGTATPPAAVNVTIADIADKHRGSLVKVTGAGLKVTEKPSAENFYVMKLEGGINIVGTFLAKDALNVFEVGDTFTSLSGIYEYQYAAKRILPISINDLAKATKKKNETTATKALSFAENLWLRIAAFFNI